MTPQMTPQTVYPSPTSSTSSFKPKPSFSTKSTSIRENVQVMVRCRPPRSKKELAEEPCWQINPERGSIALARPSSSTFSYDNVVVGVDNEQIYNSGIHDLVRSSMVGYNGTVFAYGQTASGTEAEPGVIPRAIKEVFSYIEEDTAGREYLLRVSYMEIYNEKIKDLLNSENKTPEIIEDKKNGVSVRNLKEVIVKTVKEVMTCINNGECNRHISATDYNEHSSRSHTIFQLVIESRSKGLPTHTNRGVRVSQLNLIDLAGSEKVATDIERRKEGGYINKSLLTLGNVISKLTSEEPSSHIPFRDSKLTRILQAALSGNARISVICTINPTLSSKDESLNTLRFAQRAKLIKTAAKMTRILDNSELQNCLLKIAELQTKMQEKNDLENETRLRLKSLLGLILTSSKDDPEHPEHFDTLSRFANLSAEELTKETTMRDVVARCEEGFAAQIAAHQKKIDKMALHAESMQDMMNIMESVHVKHKEVLSKRDTQIEQLKQEIASIKSNVVETTTVKSSPTQVHSFTQTPAYTPLLQATPKDDLTPAILVAVQHISEAISAGLQITHQEDDDMLTSFTDHVDLSKAVSCVFQGVLSSIVFNKPQEIHVPKNTITQALQNAIKNSSPIVVAAPELISIDEAVSFIECVHSHSFIHGVIERPEEDIPDLILSEYILDNNDFEEEEEEEEEDYSFWENKNPICNSSDDSDVETVEHNGMESETTVEITTDEKDTDETEQELIEDDDYRPYSKCMNQPLVRSILFNRWSVICCVALYILYKTN
ncbi:P-loop containing nucleoside triphosphate hydrolase protein [Thamnidium elegans]|nr:P-loop containing nucleoside triphosphate hydrolase protein [Thamnidium elegans]